MAFVMPAKPSVRTDGLSKHLATYSEYQVSHYDNIDPDYAAHAHVHKHSENEEEHEHHHDHSGYIQFDIKNISHSNAIDLNPPTLISLNNFYFENLNSDPHITSLFRPPIV